MPRIIIQALSGRTIEQKRELVRRITDATVEVFGVPAETVTIWIEENSKDNFARAGVLRTDRDGGQS